VSDRVRIVVSCTDRKRVAPAADLRLRAYDGDLDARAEAWLTRLALPASPRVAAAELYQGEHWQVCADLPAVCAATQQAVELWIVSAGYGLLAADAAVEGYGATFALRAEDSVSRLAARRAGEENARWWQHLATRPRADGAPTDLAALAEQEPDVPLLVALSAGYARALRDSLLLVSGTSDPALRPLLVPSDARFQSLLGGTLLSLNARVARHVVRRSPEHRWRGEAVRALLADELASQPERVAHDRLAMTDDEVREFIRLAMAEARTTSKSRLLRELRDGSRACEQARFGRLFDEVQEEVA
jgi:hypothetical protein